MKLGLMVKQVSVEQRDPPWSEWRRRQRKQFIAESRAALGSA